MRTTEDTHCDKGARPDESSSPSKTSVPGQWAETGRIPQEKKKTAWLLTDPISRLLGPAPSRDQIFWPGPGSKSSICCRPWTWSALQGILINWPVPGTRELGRAPLTLQEPWKAVPRGKQACGDRVSSLKVCGAGAQRGQ